MLTIKLDGNPTIRKQDLELEKQLELINKPPVKSIYVCLNFLIFHDMLPLVNMTWFNNFIFKCFILEFIDRVWPHC